METGWAATVYGGPIEPHGQARPITTARPTGAMVTHEAYIAGIRDAVLAWCFESLSPGQHRALRATKVLYGLGLGQGARGMTVYGTWHAGERHDTVEICAAGEESDLQIAGTTIHELGHVLAGHSAGHGKDWKAACAVLGLTAEASGQSYHVSAFDPALWARLEALPLPSDGKPVLRGSMGPGAPVAAKPCPLGIGTRGGKSRGTGSGSRLRKWVCAMSNPECRPHRVASDNVQATCHHCGAAFTRTESPEPVAEIVGWTRAGRRKGWGR